MSSETPVLPTNRDEVFALHADQLLVLAKHSREALYAQALETARACARRYCRNYFWIDPDDLSQSLLLKVDHWMQMFESGHSSDTSWSKYLYHKMNFYAKDVLRAEDPVGISWPQRQHYPQWHRLGDEKFDGRDVSEEESIAELSDGCAEGVDLDTSSLGTQESFGTGRVGGDLIDKEELQWQKELLAWRDYFAATPVPKIPRTTDRIWDAKNRRVRFKSKSASTGLLAWRRERQLEKTNEQLCFFEMQERVLPTQKKLRYSIQQPSGTVKYQVVFHMHPNSLWGAIETRQIGEPAESQMSLIGEEA